jgi:cytidylate kinase
MSFDVVCISREEGAAGAETAELVASRLGFRLIDEDIVARAAQDAGVSTDVVADVEQRKSMLTQLIEGLAFAGAGSPYGAVVAAPTSPPSDSLRNLIIAAIEETAASGKVVIVAHAASLALSARENVLRVLLTAPTRTREARLAANLEIDARKAARTIKDSDAARADYIRRFHKVNAEHPSHYDLVVNTERLGPENAARLIVEAAGLS